MKIPPRFRRRTSQHSLPIPRQSRRLTAKRLMPAASFGFTLVELLVVIAIIGILVAMTLPAVQASRETARRSQCVRNLSQLSLGVQNYEMAHEVFPPGVIDKQRPIHSVAQGDHRNWIIHLLPYIEEIPAYRHIDQSVGVYDPKNAAVRDITIAILECPSESGSQSTPPASSYAGVHHDVEAPIDVDNHGVFFLNSKLHADDITDGLSHTLFIGEKWCDAKDLGWMSGTRATLRNTGTPLNTPLPAAVTGATTTGAAPSNDQSTSPASPSGEASTAGKPQREGKAPAEPEQTPPAAQANAASSSASTDAASAPPSESSTSSTPAVPADPTLYVGGFGSYHPGGVNFAFGDGSVLFLTDTINMQILQQLAHRNDGKLLPATF